MPGKRSTVFRAEDHKLNFASQPINAGRPEGNFVEIVQQEQDFDYMGGSDGEGAFYEKGNKYTLVTVTLMQTSAGNDVLMAIHRASKAAGGLPSPIGIKNLGGNSAFASDAALILKTPDQTIAQEPGTTVWLIGVHDPENIVGGN